MDEFPKVPPVSPGSSKFLTLPPSHTPWVWSFLGSCLWNPPQPILQTQRAHDSSCSSFELGINSKNPAPLDLELHRQLHFQPHSLKIWFMNAAPNFGHLQISQNLKNSSDFPLFLFPTQPPSVLRRYFLLSPGTCWCWWPLLAQIFLPLTLPPLFSTPLGMWQS